MSNEINREQPDGVETPRQESLSQKNDETHARLPYEKPRVITWSAEDLENAGTSLNGCVSFFD